MPRTFKPIPVRVDDKGRLMLPKEIRAEMGVESGDVLFLRKRGPFLWLAKAENPFDALAQQAIEDYRRGETVSLRELMAREGISPADTDGDE